MKDKEVVKTLQKNNLQKYGVENTAQLEFVKNRVKQTCLQKYGTETFGQSKEYKEKCRENWNHKSKEELKIIERKRKQTSLKKYGNKNFSNRKKFKKTMLENYGKMHTNYLYRFEGQTFDSSWELAIWIYAKDHNWDIEREPCYFEYIKNGEIHKYFPDFKINGKLIEVKGRQFFKDKDSTKELINPYTKEVLLEKQQCMKNHNVEIWSREELKPYILYMEKNYGKEWKENFK